MKNITKVLIIALSIPLSTGVAMAKGGDHDGMGMNGKNKNHMMKVFKKLDLTDTQETKIKSIFAKAREDRPQMTKEQRVAAKDEWKSFMKSDEFDQAKAKALLTKKNDKRVEHELVRLKARYDAYHVLNTEQKAEFDQIVKKRMEKMRKHANK